MRRFSLHLAAAASTLLLSGGAWAQSDVGPLFSQYWAERGRDMRMNAVLTLEHRWDDDSVLLANLDRFDTDYLFFWVPTGVIVETRSVLGPEGDVEIITASLVDPNEGTDGGTSSLTMTYYRDGLALEGQEDSASAEQALDLTREQLVAALSEVGSVTTTPVTRRLGGFMLPGVEIEATRGDARTMSFLTALRYQNGAILTVYFHREQADLESLDLLGAVMSSVWPGSYDSYGAAVGEMAAASAAQAEQTQASADEDEEADGEPIP